MIPKTLAITMMAMLVVLLSPDAYAGTVGTIVSGKARFQILDTSLIRMEYSESAKFVDQPSVVVLNRSDWPEVKYTSDEKDGWLQIATDTLKLRYKIGGGSFSQDNLQVSWHDETGDRSWKPWDKDEKNLGGITLSLDSVLKPEVSPGLLSRNGWTLFDDSQTPLRNADTQWIEPRPRGEADHDWYLFVYGTDYTSFFKDYTKLTGPIPMLPHYVFGAMTTSRIGYSADEWKKIAWRFRDEGIPMDAIVMDSFSSAKVIWAGYDWEPVQMPNPKEFLSWMHDRGFRVARNEHYYPLPKADSKFEAVRQAMGLPEDIGEIPHDLANKKYADLFMNVLHKPSMDIGLDFWWMDGYTNARIPGIDDLMWNREIEYAGTEKITGKRAFLMARHGGWGSHRYPAYFTGDAFSRWDMLAYQIPYTVQAGNVLEAYVTHDLGGFWGTNTDPEMYARWLQFGALGPMTRLHSVYGMRMPWEYGDLGMEQAHKFLGLHYSLIPYSYTYGRIAHETGLPLIRGMYIEYPKPEQSYALKHQYMYGKELLVSPIVESGHGKPVLKDVFLPEGEDWFDYFTGRIYRGGQVLPYECPLDRMPLFVKAGSIIPMAPRMDYTTQKPLDPLTLDVYAGAKPATFRLYEDDGESFDYRKGEYSWTEFTFAPSGAGGSYTFTIGPREGKFKGMLKSRRYEVRLHGLLKPDAIAVNGKKFPQTDDSRGQGWSFDRASGVTTVSLIEPLTTEKPVTLAIKNAGTFEDVIALQKAIDFRERVRSVKHQERLIYIAVGVLQDTVMPPRCIRETDAVEWQLDDIIDNPKGLAANKPDYKAMADRILKSLVDKPFEADRPIPHPDTYVAEAYAGVIDKRFTQIEVDRMTSTLLGITLPTHIVYDGRIQQTGDNLMPLLQTKLCYDTDIVGEGKVDIQVQLPDSPLPGWVAGRTWTAENGYTWLWIRQPNELPNGTYTLRVKANLTWEGGQTELWRDVQWVK